MKKLAIAGISAICTMATISAVTLPATPAQAIPVFDALNYAQNILTAARELQQITNQITSLQNQATSLSNQAKNLSTIGFPELNTLTQTLQQIDVLMGKAQGIQFNATNTTQQFQSLYPQSFNSALTNNQHMADAQTRLTTAMQSFSQTMTLQSQVVQNVQADATTLSEIVSRSQGAVGALQATQATNQLLALTAKQQFQIQTLMAGQARAQAIAEANRVQSQSDARAAATKFLGSGSAYTPQ
ncbi:MULTISPECIES: P-type conjugative transfer protein TrbJ [unclassified Sphingomonas]|uniref:P-type conjugative transfer protein TrbJ n=1 Tax=unclassified Sphingomonas TaxID=196159 RepID=UPI0006FC3044|nr:MULTISPECIES: P-type conjugative transfer protein TrbJ [unclassified Sphingomonas]KQX19665.1 conjugal transfer protein TrbJ [Sphingomonas sp. Root1294]KQY65866.1 conjugal transfer protein TrbJ [Sphingomonas sp. Root50]KRB95557.1 conjugal transfer protein TrbJ [Sphingomonas sp. Root720]